MVDESIETGPHKERVVPMARDFQSKPLRFSVSWRLFADSTGHLHLTIPIHERRYSRQYLIHLFESGELLCASNR